MIDGIEMIYQQIADEMVSDLPAGWRQAKIDAVYYPEGADYDGEYITEAGKERSGGVTIKATQVFDELRRKFKDAGHRVWGRATFELHSDGAFNMKWDYDNCDENGDKIWDPDEWSRQQDERRLRLNRP